MATTRTLYSCGHVEERTAPRCEGDASFRAPWPCPPCREQEGLSLSGPGGMAALSGTPEQVEWADGLRRALLDTIDRFAEGLPVPPGLEDLSEATLSEMRLRVAGQPSAQAVIEYWRGYDALREYSSISQEVAYRDQISIWV